MRIHELSKYTGVSIRTLQKYVNKGLIPCKKLDSNNNESCFDKDAINVVFRLKNLEMSKHSKVKVGYVNFYEDLKSYVISKFCFESIMKDDFIEFGKDSFVNDISLVCIEKLVIDGINYDDFIEKYGSLCSRYGIRLVYIREYITKYFSNKENIYDLFCYNHDLNTIRKVCDKIESPLGFCDLMVNLYNSHKLRLIEDYEDYLSYLEYKGEYGDVYEPDDEELYYYELRREELFDSISSEINISKTDVNVPSVKSFLRDFANVLWVKNKVGYLSLFDCLQGDDISNFILSDSILKEFGFFFINTETLIENNPVNVSSHDRVVGDFMSLSEFRISDDFVGKEEYIDIDLYHRFVKEYNNELENNEKVSSFSSVVSSGDLCSSLGCSKQTVKNYEKLGILKGVETDKNNNQVEFELNDSIKNYFRYKLDGIFNDENLAVAYLMTDNKSVDNKNIDLLKNTFRYVYLISGSTELEEINNICESPLFLNLYCVKKIEGYDSLFRRLGVEQILL